MELLFIIGIIAIAIFLKWYRSPQQKGKRGEKRVAALLKKLSDDYYIINNAVFLTKNGTTQVDHVVVSKYGVFAIETKNYKGEIYGDDTREEWTQVIVTNVTYQRKWWKTYTYVTKNQMYNPVKQASGHAFRIKKILEDYNNLPVVPILVFVGSADISHVNSDKHVIYSEQLLSVIESYQNVYLSDADVQSVLHSLQVSNVSETIDNKMHVSYLNAAEKRRTNKVNAGICPKCGEMLVERRGKYGAFWGCSNYPRCRYTIT